MAGTSLPPDLTPRQVVPAKQFPDPIPNIIPFGTLTMFAGATGAGKTTMVAGMMLPAWLDGGEICGWAVQPASRVTWVTADRGKAETKVWFERAGIDLALVEHYGIVDDLKFPIGKLHRPQSVLEAFHYTLEQIGVTPGMHLIFDPVTPLFIIGDSNKARDVALTMMRYNRICQERKINITLLGHFGKQRARHEDRYARPQDRIAGSNAFGGYTSTQIYLLDPEPPDQPYWQLGWVPRHGGFQTFNYTRDKNGLFVPFGEAPTSEPADDRRLAFLTVIPQSWVLFKALVAIFEGMGIPVSTAYRYKQQLQSKGLIECDEKGNVRLAASKSGLVS